MLKAEHTNGDTSCWSSVVIFVCCFVRIGLEEEPDDEFVAPGKDGLPPPILEPLTLLLLLLLPPLLSASLEEFCWQGLFGEHSETEDIVSVRGSADRGDGGYCKVDIDDVIYSFTIGALI